MAKQQYAAIGAFMDESYAQRAIQLLQQAGIRAQIADQGTVQKLGSLGFTDQEARLYQGRLQEGNTIVVAEAGNGSVQPIDILLQAGAENIDMSKQGQGAQYYQSLPANNRQYGPYDQDLGRARSADEARLILRREELIANKQAVQAGEVTVRKTVHEHQQEIPVTLQHEEVTIERRPLEGPVSEADLAAGEQTIRVPVYEEQVQLQKQVRGEEFVVNKQAVQEQRTVQGTVRHENVEVDQAGNIEITGDANSRYQTGGGSTSNPS